MSEEMLNAIREYLGEERYEEFLSEYEEIKAWYETEILAISETELESDGAVDRTDLTTELEEKIEALFDKYDIPSDLLDIEE